MRTLTRLAAAAAVAAALFVPAASPAAASPERVRCSVVYFDLGGTLVDTSDRTAYRYMPGAREHLRLLRVLGVPMGVITNVPPSWGADDAQRAARVREFIAASWAEPEPFPWHYFEAPVLTPRSTAEYKPAPALFERALTAAGQCRAFFQGEDAAEISAAEATGLTGYQIGQPGRRAYLPPGHIFRP
ncbi:hypothetical protein [Longispora albida]|uniref:hypothetical protein n=1 Tax=Longispora albida TaxID=203523 RepID=UPI00036D9512|nr:hypothetical protein [Longispora albida]